MRFLVISDLHGDTEHIDMLKEEFSKADAVLCGGDFARFNQEETGLPTLKHLLSCHDTIYAVTGNCDNPDFIEALEDEDINVQNTMVFRDGIVFSGSGGGAQFTGVTPNERTEEELVADFNVVKEQKETTSWSNMIMIMHQPPKDTACDTITSGAHVGSPALRQVIEELQPLAVVTGHIHESFGKDTIGKTLVINPGSLAEGRYAVLEVVKSPEGEWSIKEAELKTLS